ncbi:hypothetical protein Ancab_012321 [Ancistrocladus abbreviatus]
MSMAAYCREDEIPGKKKDVVGIEAEKSVNARERYVDTSHLVYCGTSQEVVAKNGEYCSNSKNGLERGAMQADQESKGERKEPVGKRDSEDMHSTSSITDSLIMNINKVICEEDKYVEENDLGVSPKQI